MDLRGKSILLIISGGIAAYKALELIRLIRKNRGNVRCILTKGGEEFITPLSVASLSENECYTDLWSLKDETEMGHIRLSRESDLVVIAPASANLIGQMAGGLAQDLASTALLANNKPVLMAPAMNHEMWNDPATQANIQKLKDSGIMQVGPTEGDMACGEFGMGRMAEPDDILSAIITHFEKDKPLAGYKALVTSGPTYEPIDPVRFIGNRSSGKQGHAIAQELADAGAAVTLVTGPVAIPDPHGVETIHIETAADMLAASQDSGPFDIAVCAAAVSDWRVESTSASKIKKAGSPPTLELTENPDILATVAGADNRPKLVIGFAAETDNVLGNAKTKIDKKGCDMILANDVSGDRVFGQDETHINLLTKTTHEDWGVLSKTAVAKELTTRIIQELANKTLKDAAE